MFGQSDAPKSDDNPAAASFFRRLSQAYLIDWKGSSAAPTTAPVTKGGPNVNTVAAPTYRGYPQSMLLRTHFPSGLMVAPSQSGSHGLKLDHS